ncbi:hypothetical protein ACOMHN_045684 [Nucella lapillus]
MSRAKKSKQQHKCYAVSNGRTMGIYDTWNATSKSVTGFPKAVFKGYDSMDKAKNAMRVTGITEPTILLLARYHRANNYLSIQRWMERLAHRANNYLSIQRWMER